MNSKTNKQKRIQNQVSHEWKKKHKQNERTEIQKRTQIQRDKNTTRDEGDEKMNDRGREKK